MAKKTFDLNAIGKSALLQEQVKIKTDDNEKKNKLIRGIPKHYLEAITELKKRRVYRLSANDFFIDAVAEKLDRMKKKLT
ncbi:MULTISPECIES: hypothetical protein [Arsenophonus]|uniref:hypothetical protein n=1 Tax=Arsenophonus TaxID=637 RepID=UPI00387994B5